MSAPYLDQFGPLVGNKLVINGVAFDDAQYQGPTNVKYIGPEKFTAVSGRPYLQGPIQLVATWKTMTADSFQGLYVQYNLNENTGPGPRVTLSWYDPRQAARLVDIAMWMDEPQFEEEELYIRNVTVSFTSVIE